MCRAKRYIPVSITLVKHIWTQTRRPANYGIGITSDQINIPIVYLCRPIYSILNVRSVGISNPILISLSYNIVQRGYRNLLLLRKCQSLPKSEIEEKSFKEKNHR